MAKILIDLPGKGGGSNGFPRDEANRLMRHSFVRRRPRARHGKPGQTLHLELLEARTLLDGSGVVLHHPEAILRPHDGALGAPASPTAVPVQLTHSIPPPGGFPNVLVNNPGEDGTSRQDTQSETTLVLDGSTVLAAFNDSTLYNGNSSPHFTGMSRSDDTGMTFLDLGGLLSIPGGDGGDPVLARDEVSGRVYLAALSLSNSSSLPIFRSDDDFHTYLSTTVITKAGASVDKEWMAVDNASGPGQGNVYVVYRDFGSGNGVYFFRSTDQGATFGPTNGVQIVSAGGGNVQGPWVTVGPDHAVYAFWYDATSSTQSIKMRKSTDQGVSFGPAITVTTLRTTGTNGDLSLGGGFRSNAFAQALVNPQDPNQVYVVYDDKGAGTDKGDVYFRQSNDGGMTWSVATDVVDDTTGRDQWQPALAVLPNGADLGVFWYDRRLDPADSLIDRFGAIGVIAGGKVTFSPNFRITDTSFPVAHGQDPVVNPVYMGDYDQAVADNTGFDLTWGDNRSPSRGHSGNNADVRFVHIPVSVAGPAVIAITPRGDTFAPVATLRVVFDEPMDPASFTPDQFVIRDLSGNTVPITDIAAVDGTDERFDVSFDPLTATSLYSVKIGPNLTDQNGNAMDQDGDGIPTGQDPSDAFFGSFGIVGLKVTASTPTGGDSLPGGVDHVRLTFNEPVNPATFTPDQVASFTGPDGSHPVTDIEPVAGSNNTQFDISFAALTAAGAYALVVGPDIQDQFGNAMDQDGDHIPGEPSDQYTAAFSVATPRIVQFIRNGALGTPPTSVRATFNEPVDPGTFTVAQVPAFTDPHGNAIPVTDVQPVAGSDNTQFDISFAAQTLFGAYTMTIGPDIQDLYGNPMAAPFMGSFVVTPVYTAAAYPFEDLDIHGLPGTFRVIQYADDDSVPVDLGQHTFNFYGKIYTGNNRLFASSNALINFGKKGDAGFDNGNLSTQPKQAAIAPLWSDWIKESGTDMLEGYFDEANDRLILQWNAIQHYPMSPRGITFQVILYLDTGGEPGDIIFNYVDLDTGDANRDGQTSTVGVKNTDKQQTNTLLVSFNQANPLIGSGLAILITANQGGRPGGSATRHRPGRPTAGAADVSLGVALDVFPPSRVGPQPRPATPDSQRAEARATAALSEPGTAGVLDPVISRLGAEGVGADPLASADAPAGDGLDLLAPAPLGPARELF